MDYAIHDLSDGERVVLSANLLDTSEFEIFRHAYADWYGRAVDEQTLEQDFSRYLFRGQAPPWVRHYTRILLDEQKPVYVSSFQPTPHKFLERLLDNRVTRFLFG